MDKPLASTGALFARAREKRATLKIFIAFLLPSLGRIAEA
jgi:hypothetical protein